MRRYCAMILLMVLAASQTAPAHPLGNFSVNRCSRIEVTSDRVRVRYVLDMAEIPAFQEMAAIDLDGDGRVDDVERPRYLGQRTPALLRNLHLSLNGAPAALTVVSQGLSFPPGQAGLATLRLVCDFEALTVGGGGVREGNYRDDNSPGRLGWKEVVVRAGEGVSLRWSTAPDRDRTDELRAYPQDALAGSPERREARFAFAPASGAGAGAQGAAQGVSPRAGDRFAALVSGDERGLPVVLFSLLIAFGLGALHALSPGHGKTVVGAYLVGARGTARDALFLGLTVTATHTSGVFALGLVTLYASRYILPERLYPWLSLASGLIVAGIGLTLFVRRLRGARPHTHGDGEVHDHPHDHAHSHIAPGADPVTWRGLLALGVSGGLLPCPSALVVLLSAIAFRRVGFGMLLIVAFSAGLAAALTGVGLLFVRARGVLERFRTDGALAGALPALSACVVTGAGAVIAAQALTQVGVSPQRFFGGLFQTACSVLALGFVLGLRHAMDADHVAAVSTIVSERRGVGGSSLVGAVWGLGHTAALLVAGLAVIALHVPIPEGVAQAMEFGVAAMLAALGVNLLRRLFEGGTLHIHPHRHEGRWHAHTHPHPHGMQGLEEADRSSGSHGAARVGRRPFFVGMAHGLAGSAALMLMVLATIPSRLLGLVYIGVFGLGSVGGMLLMSALIGLPFGGHGRAI